MRVLFGFANAELLEFFSPSGDFVIEYEAKIIFHDGLRKYHWCLGGVGAEGYEVRLEFGRELVRKLSGAVGAKVEEDHGIVFVDEAVFVQEDWL